MAKKTQLLTSHDLQGPLRFRFLLAYSIKEHQGFYREMWVPPYQLLPKRIFVNHSISFWKGFTGDNWFCSSPVDEADGAPLSPTCWQQYHAMISQSKHFNPVSDPAGGTNQYMDHINAVAQNVTTTWRDFRKYYLKQLWWKKDIHRLDAIRMGKSLHKQQNTKLCELKKIFKKRGIYTRNSCHFLESKRIPSDSKLYTEQV